MTLPTRFPQGRALCRSSSVRLVAVCCNQSRNKAGPDPSIWTTDRMGWCWGHNRGLGNQPENSIWWRKGDCAPTQDSRRPVGWLMSAWRFSPRCAVRLARW